MPRRRYGFRRHKEPEEPGRLIGIQEMPEGKDFADFLTGQGVSHTSRDVHGVGTSYDVVHELAYERPGEGKRYAYVVNHQYDSDAYGQDVFIFSKPVPDALLGETLKQARHRQDVPASDDPADNPAHVHEWGPHPTHPEHYERCKTCGHARRIPGE